MKDKVFLVVLVLCIISFILAILLWPVNTTYTITLLLDIPFLLLLYYCFRGSGVTIQITATPDPVLKKPSNTHDESYIPEVEETTTDLSMLPIETIEGIGKVYGSKLRQGGITTVLDLLVIEPEKIASICEVNVEQAERWIAMSRFAWLDNISEEDAEAIVFATGITTLAALAEADSEVLLQKIERAVIAGKVRVPADYEFTLEKIEKWIIAAKNNI